MVSFPAFVNTARPVSSPGTQATYTIPTVRPGREDQSQTFLVCVGCAFVLIGTVLFLVNPGTIMPQAV